MNNYYDLPTMISKSDLTLEQLQFLKIIVDLKIKIVRGD